MTSRRKLLGSLVVAAAVVAAVGCSSDDGASSTTTAKGPSTTAASGTSKGPDTTGVPATAPISAPVGVDEQRPVGPGTPVDFGGGVTATLTGSRTVDVEAHSPGETSGPGVAATIEVENGSKQPFDLTTIAVTATYGDGTPAIVSRSDPASDLTGTVAAGRTATGVYVFRVPKDQADTLLIQVQSGVKPNSLQFKV